jgi:predicted nucleic acid-binding protein
MKLVDSSCWLEYFAGTDLSENYASAIEDTGNLVVPTISLYEVFKRILSQADEGSALQAIAQMQQAQVVSLTPSIALSAAVLSAQHKLPMADSIILATARETGAILWTQDEDFKGLDGVKYFPKK